MILDRNTPVARLVSVTPVDAEEERMQRLAAQVIMIPARDPLNRAGFHPVPAGDRVIPQEVMDQIWEEEREDRC